MALLTDRVVTDRVVVITGGGRGIGRQHCLELGRQGATVVVVDPGVGVRGETTDEDPADLVAGEIEEAGGKAFPLKASVSSWSECKAIVDATLERCGRLDAVVNNAGILRDRMITSMDEEDFDSVIDVHLKGTFQMIKHACDHWRATAKAGGDSSGHIVNTTSGAGLNGNIGQANYAAAKAGIVALTLVTALEMARYGVTCNAISPLASTRMTTGILASPPPPDPSDTAFDPLHPGTTSPLVAYLASPASSWLSGQVLRVEGNTVIRMQGWERSTQRYTARSGTFLQADELIDGPALRESSWPTRPTDHSR